MYLTGIGATSKKIIIKHRVINISRIEFDQTSFCGKTIRYVFHIQNQLFSKYFPEFISRSQKDSTS
jgi:hypothetical protein